MFDEVLKSIPAEKALETSDSPIGKDYKRCDESQDDLDAKSILVTWIVPQCLTLSFFSA